MNVDDNMLLQYINKLPTDLIRYTKPYLSISIVKKVRKIHKNELPLNYIVCKDLNDFFYKKYIGYKLDIKILQFNISQLKNKQLQNKRNIVNPCSFEFWQDPFTNDSCIYNEIGKKENQIKMLEDYMNYYFYYYFQSSEHLYNFKIMELD